MAPQVCVQSSVCFVSLFRVAVQRVSVFDLLADGLKLSHELSPFMHGQTHHRGINLSFLTFAKSRLEIGKSWLCPRKATDIRVYVSALWSQKQEALTSS